jgi:hypothetical protein
MLMSTLPPRRSTLHHVAVLCVGALATIAHAQSTAVIPPGAEFVAGTLIDSRPLGDAPRGVYQVFYDAALMTAIPPGSVITGLQVRQTNTFAPSSFPSTARNLDRFDITLAASSRTFATVAPNFATNMLNPVLVRSGTLGLAAGAYPGGPGGSAPLGFGPVIAFTRGFVYSGGPLVIEFRVQDDQGGDLHFADVTSAVGLAKEVVTSLSADASTSTVVFSDSGLVVRLTFTPPPVDLAKGVTKVTVGDAMVATAADSGYNELTVDFGATSVSTMAANQFDTIGPGSDFVGLAYRANLIDFPAFWPTAPANYGAFDIQLSRSTNPPGSLSDVFASNVGADAVTVRSGPLSVPVGAVASAGSQPVAPFSWEIPFVTPYSYRGGPLLSVIRHTGQAVGVADALLEATGTPALGWGSAFESRAALSYTATETGFGGFPLFTVRRYSVDAASSSPLNQQNPSNSFLGGPLSERMQVVLSASEMRYIPVGSVIDSLWLRQFASPLVGAPGVDTSALDFEISLSSAVNPPESVSTTFAENQGSDLVLVHDGPLSIAAGTFPPGSVGTFGKLAQFRRQFVYKGGPLCIDIRHSGLSALINTLDLVPSSPSENRVLVNSDPNATSGGFFASGYTGLAVKLGYIPSVISPNNLATGTSNDPWILAGISNYAIQFIVPASQLLAVDYGSAITGLSLRRASVQSTSSSPFPATQITVPRFDVWISGANTSPLTMTTTYADNSGMDEVLARSGPLTIPANAFPAVGVANQPNDNAWYINFDRGYVYQGGDLCLTIRGRGPIDFAGLFEGSEGSPAQIGRAVYNYSDDNATQGFFYSPLALRFAFTPRAFCPADLNNDGVVDDFDFQLFAGAYNILDCNDLGMPLGCPSDLNFDRVVDDLDFQVFVVAYNEVLCP